MRKLIIIIVVIIPMTATAQWNLIYYGAQNGKMAVINKDTIIAVNGSAIHRSTNGGQTWSIYQTIFTTSLLLDVHFPTKTIGYACGGTAFGNHKNIIAKTINGGQSWDSLTSNSFIGYSFTNIHFVNADTGFVSGDLGLLKTTDGGISYTPITLSGSVTDIIFTSNQNGLVSTSKYLSSNTYVYSLLKTTDLGSSWTEVYTDTMTGVTGLNHRIINEIYFIDDNSGYAVGGNGLFLKTTNGGSSWTSSFINPYTNLTGLHFTSENVGYMNNAGGIYKTTDGGVSWQVQNISPLSIINRIHFANDTIGYAAGDAGIFKTINGGQTTGLSELHNNFSISIFPNPFSTQTTLQTDNLLKNATLTVYNLYGQTVKQIKNISGQTVTLSRDNLASGLYFVRLKQDNKVIAADKLVITD